MGRTAEMSQGQATELRTKNYHRQLTGSVVFKVVAVGTSFLALPLMVRYLGQERFGIWSTLLSILSWLVFFDFGIGNGLRNKLAEALAKGDNTAAARYIASGYTMTGLISLVLFAGVVAASLLVPWQRVFNTAAVSGAELRILVLCVGFIITLNFWLGLINQIYHAQQQASIVVLGQAISNLLVLFLVFVLSLSTDASILRLAIAYGSALVIANLLLSFHFYHRHPEFAPKPFWDRRYFLPLLSLGGQFFIIQLAVLVIFTTDKLLITQLFGPERVTEYEVVYKLFSIITLGYGLVSAPLWSAYTDAYHRGDIAWIKAALFRQLWVFTLIAFTTAIIAITAKEIITIWIGAGLDISMPLIISMAVFILVSVWNNIYAYPLNGIGRLRIQTFTALIGMIVNIPLSVVLAIHYGQGIAGIVWGTVFSLSLFGVLAPFQMIRIMKERKNVLANG